MNLVSLEDYETVAKDRIPEGALGYYRSGAGDEFSLSLNKVALNRLRLRPRFLRDVSVRNMTYTIFGDTVSMPLGICPTAMQKMAHPDGELANARAAEKAGIIFTLSTISTSSIEEVAQAAPKCIKWFQLYIYKDRDATKKLVRRAELAGFKAIVLTVDAPVFGVRRADIRNNFNLPSHLRFANFEDDKSKSDSKDNDERISGINKYVTSQFDPTLNWNDLKWLVQFTKLPVLVKGVLTREDAILAVEFGARGVIVSNHGARQLDGVPAPIEVLPEIVDAVGSKTEVIIDGGIMQGTDILKVIALGAKMAFIGRPALWGLAVNGQNGVEGVIDILRRELDNAMSLCGCKSLKSISRELVVHENYYSKL